MSTWPCSRGSGSPPAPAVRSLLPAHVQDLHLGQLRAACGDERSWRRPFPAAVTPSAAVSWSRSSCAHSGKQEAEPGPTLRRGFRTEGQSQAWWPVPKAETGGLSEIRPAWLHSDFKTSVSHKGPSPPKKQSCGVALSFWVSTQFLSMSSAGGRNPPCRSGCCFLYPTFALNWPGGAMLGARELPAPPSLGTDLLAHCGDRSSHEPGQTLTSDAGSQC